MRNCIAMLLVFVVVHIHVSAQDSSILKLQQIPSGYADKVASKAASLEEKLDKRTAKALHRFQKIEAKMKRKLMKIDSLAANNIFTNAEKKYKALEGKLSNSQGGQYIPRLDTLVTSLKFLQQNPELLSQAKEIKTKLKDALSKVNGLKDQFSRAEEVQQFLRERRRLLSEQLAKLGFGKSLKKLNKEAYYYAQQVREYKEIFKDPAKIEQKAIELLSKTKFFQDFMKKNSMLASLFPSPAGGNASAGPQTGFAALQTRAQVVSFMQQSGINPRTAMPQLQRNIQDAQSQVNQLRNEINRVTGGNGGNDLEVPDFKPNSQKTKSFFKRLEYTTSLQSQKANGFFPATSDLGLSVGYKLNDRSIVGVGASYKLGLGNGWNDIRFSHQGLGLRSFIDWKIKGSFWISGGYEQNYRTAFNTIDQLRNLSAWQQSGLLGMSKTVSLKSKFLKKTKLQLLWDFLSYQQRPITQPLLFRVGYSF